MPSNSEKDTAEMSASDIREKTLTTLKKCIGELYGQLGKAGSAGTDSAHIELLEKVIEDTREAQRIVEASISMASISEKKRDHQRNAVDNAIGKYPYPKSDGAGYYRLGKTDLARLGKGKEGDYWHKVSRNLVDQVVKACHEEATCDGDYSHEFSVKSDLRTNGHLVNHKGSTAPIYIALGLLKEMRLVKPSKLRGKYRLAVEANESDCLEKVMEYISELPEKEDL